jgi:hypothetical protein
MEDRVLDQEGQWCNVDGCKGWMEWQRELGEGCSCHLGHPPCSACINMKLTCTRCGSILEEESDIEDDRNMLTRYTDLGETDE